MSAAGTAGNASSVHAEGRAARALMDAARARVAQHLGVSDDEVIFTASGTESDNLAIRGVIWASPEPRHVVISGIEHEAVRRTARWLEARGIAAVTVVPPASDGVVRGDEMLAACRPGTSLVSLMAVNNEIGTVQEVEHVGAGCRDRGITLHCDAVQALGRLDLAPLARAAPLLTLSPHKAGGPTGVGVLAVRRGLKLDPPMTGGEQESGLRPGTESAPLAAGAAAAIAIACETRGESTAELGRLGARLEEGLSSLEGVVIHGRSAQRVPGFVNAAFDGCDAVALVQALDLAGFAVSSGSACSSGSVRPSAVLEAMGLPPALCRSSVRFSLGAGNDAAQVEALLAALPSLLARLRAGP